MYSKKVGGGPPKTAWVKPQSQPPGNRSNASQKKPQGMPKFTKSDEVVKIEKLIDALEKGVNPKAGQTGCFCMARKHDLSIYTPICHFCGLILCELQSPASPCPSCFSPILSDRDRAALLARLEGEKSHQLAMEAEQREQERIRKQQEREIQAGGGAFPSLATSTSSGSSIPQRGHTPTSDGGGGSHKVLSLNARTKHVTVRTITPSVSAPNSRPASRAVTAEELAEKERMKPVPAPSDEVNYVKDARAPADRPWMNLRGPSLTYIPVELDPSSQRGHGEKKKRQRGGQKKSSLVGVVGATPDALEDSKVLSSVEGPREIMTD
ncbi:hypothetical protein FRB93_004337 [Tulasnella sp. JGI-2019a]|nr:hypothetical protein FRB93_004337 [Tulasnella sp. JGI-2019a]